MTITTSVRPTVSQTPCPIDMIHAPDKALSRRVNHLAGQALSVTKAPPSQKRAYFWLKAKEGDLALCTKDRHQDRELNMEALRRNGYAVTLFKTNQAFLDHIKRDSSQVDLLIISGHGRPTKLADLVVEGDRVVSIDPKRRAGESASSFKTLQNILKNKSIVVFHSCLTGNKSVQHNIARIASRILPQSRIYAPQSRIVLEPTLLFQEDSAREGEGVVTGVSFGRISPSSERVETLEAAIYKNGVETTGQKPWPYTPPSSGRLKRYIVAAMMVAGAVLSLGFGWYGRGSSNA